MAIAKLRMPVIAARLNLIADVMEEHGLFALAQQQRWLSDQTYRRKAVRRAPRTATPITREIRTHLKHDALAHPEKTLRDIAKPYGVDGGRASEAVAGFRDGRSAA